MKKLPRGKKLEVLISKYGISQHNQASPTVGNDDSELQRRLLAFLEHRRANRLWVIAVVSAIASMFSAAAAWYAVFNGP